MFYFIYGVENWWENDRGHHFYCCSITVSSLFSACRCSRPSSSQALCPSLPCSSAMRSFSLSPRCRSRPVVGDHPFMQSTNAFPATGPIPSHLLIHVLDHPRFATATARKQPPARRYREPPLSDGCRPRTDSRQASCNQKVGYWASRTPRPPHRVRRLRDLSPDH